MTPNKIIIEDRKAIKEHKCNICKSKIYKKEYYTCITKFVIGTGYVNIKMCLHHSLKKVKI